MPAIMNSSNEIDVRQEVYDFFNGKDFGNEKFNILLHRQIRKDTVNAPFINKIKCTACNYNDGSVGKTGCPKCDGIGYLWDERLITGYMYRPQQIRLSDQLSRYSRLGQMDQSSFILITASKYEISLGDILYSVDLNSNGGINIPIVKTNKYICSSSIPMRLDFNKVEYYSTIISEIH